MELRLTNLVNEKFILTGIVIEKKRSKKNLTIKNIIRGVINRTVFYIINKAWSDAQIKFGNEYQKWPKSRSLIVDNINSSKTIDFTKNQEYDIIIVSSTSLIKKELINLKGKLGILNLHTGFSPYIKGGPNCSNWCLANREYHKMGNTIMFLDLGIDSGKIIKSRLLQLDKKWSHSEILYQTIKQGQDLYIDSLIHINELKGELKSVSQDSISRGITYYNKQWGIKQRAQLIINFYFGHFQRHLATEEYRQNISKLIIVK